MWCGVAVLSGRQTPWRGGVMTGRDATIERLEGRHVNVTLADGSQIGDCELVSAGHHAVASLWLCADGADLFVPLIEVSDVREAVTSA